MSKVCLHCEKEFVARRIITRFCSKYCACAENKAMVKKLYNALKKYQKANSKSDYLSDYSKTEQKVFKNAIYGKKGTFVWYIAMSPSKAVNKKGQAALKKKL